MRFLSEIIRILRREKGLLLTAFTVSLNIQQTFSACDEACGADWNRGVRALSNLLHSVIIVFICKQMKELEQHWQIIPALINGRLTLQRGAKTDDGDEAEGAYGVSTAPQLPLPTVFGLCGQSSVSIHHASPVHDTISSTSSFFYIMYCEPSGRLQAYCH